MTTAEHLIVKIMDFDTWFDTFQPEDNHLDDNASFNGKMFETFGAEVQYVCDKSNADALRAVTTGEHGLYVWTYIDGDEGTVIVEGYRLVNRIGYFLTKVSAEPNRYYVVGVS